MENSIGYYLSDVETKLAELEKKNIVARIWQKDHTVWKQDPAEITNRLGWLTVTDFMQEQVSALESFADDVQKAGFRYVVLLGMGGSSLSSEVLRQTFSTTQGFPELHVLDSTIPACVQAITDRIYPASTLFIVSSKSGTTIEVVSLFQYFRNLIESTVEKQGVGQNFITITDAGTSLARTAEEERFRHIFLNPTDIGGRYSVLSYFGLVPAALTGINIGALLDSAQRMKKTCAPDIPIQQNPGAWLGTLMGILALQGRDKLTLVTSPGISSFGLWVEQLIAESTGKEGKGIIPVVGEPLMESADYGTDRLFVYLRLQNDDNLAIDTAVEPIKASGQPVVILEMQDWYDLGTEFYRWEFATAVAGAILGINPFEQPDVQAAKQATQDMLDKFITSGSLPQVETASSPTDLLTGVKSGNYLAVLAYIQQTQEADRLLSEFRKQVVKKYRLATTLGYGPRYLHSTGQLHKGGPNTGRFLFITADHEKDVPIPGRPYNFGVLADAQALGDLQALQSLGRSVARIHSSKSDTPAISRLLSELQSKL
jgi:glucose-6-phosphate isomerase